MFKLAQLIRFFVPTLHLDSGGGGGGGPSTSTTQTSNIPEYARPYVETMLGATQKHLFETRPTGDGGTEITGMKPYTPYSTNMNDYFAGASPMQEQAYTGAANMQVAPQNQTATGMATQAGIGALNAAYNPAQFANQFQAPQDYQAGRFRANNIGTQSFAQPGTADAYMNPYMQNVVDIQQREARRASDITGQQNAARAVGQGAFGGSRAALVEAERQRNLGTQLGDIQAAGSNAAYNQAMQQFNAEQQARLTAQQANQQAGLQAQQLGEQSRQFGAGQGMTAAQLQAQYGLSADQAAEASRQFSANYGMQGIQNALNAANQLGTLGQNQYQQQQGIIGLQNQLGQQQQQLEQNKINQAIQNYATGQQWGMQQLSNMNAMLRGLPLQTTSTATYQAAPSITSQLAGLGTAAYGASKLAAKGGSTKDIKKRKGAGLMDLALSKIA